ncbi:MAG: SCP2 sterol-binding domain-containing protein [Rubrivivax sp.]|nr:SCP2 sterol-binding domain-containing protein [Rubrivivax sp.]MDP3610666.1 SCP2 sterol-binding domain-containing protein [Rubrivivax sp.]
MNRPHPAAQPTPPTGTLPLPPLVAGAARHLQGLLRRLPTEPPSFVLARLLDRLLLPRLDETQRQLLGGHCVEIELIEPGLRVRLQLGARGFEVANAHQPAALVVRAQALALWRLVRGQDDADRLFFDRALVMEGDTELGLVLKNTLDAIGPLWPLRAS